MSSEPISTKSATFLAGMSAGWLAARAWQIGMTVLGRIAWLALGGALAVTGYLLGLGVGI